MTLIGAVVKGLRDLRNDLFAHLETRPSSFYDRVAVGRIMTRVTNDVEALYELLRGARNSYRRVCTFSGRINCNVRD